MNQKPQALTAEQFVEFLEMAVISHSERMGANTIYTVRIPEGDGHYDASLINCCDGSDFMIRHTSVC